MTALPGGPDVPDVPDAVVVLSAAEPVRGMERAALDVVAALRADGLAVDVHVLTPVLPPGPTGRRRRTRRDRARAFAASFLAARRLARTPGPPLVLVGIWVGLRTLPWVRPAARGGRRVVAWEHSLTPERRAAVRSFDLVARAVLPLYRRRAARVVAVSPAVAGALAAVPGLAGRTTVIANPVSGPAGPPPVRRPRTGAPQLLYLGGLEPLKNPGLALEALALLPGAHLHVAGTGRPEGSLRRRAGALGVAERVTFHGFTDRVPQLLARADVLVHPSRSETFGYALLEAAQAHVPVVAVSTPQAEHLVPRLVPGRTSAPTARALADAVTAVLAGPPSAAEHAAADAARAAEFSLSALVAAWREVLEDRPGGTAAT